MPQPSSNHSGYRREQWLPTPIDLIQVVIGVELYGNNHLRLI